MCYARRSMRDSTPNQVRANPSLLPTVPFVENIFGKAKDYKFAGSGNGQLLLHGIRDLRRQRFGCSERTWTGFGRNRETAASRHPAVTRFSLSKALG